MAREPKNELAETALLLNFFSFYFLGGRRGQLKKEKLKDERPASSSNQCSLDCRQRYLVTNCK